MTAEAIYWDRPGRRWDTCALATYRPVTLSLISWLDQVDRGAVRLWTFSSVSMSRLAQEPKHRVEYSRQFPTAAFNLISGRVTRSQPDPRWTLPRAVMDDVSWAAYKNMHSIDYIRDGAIWGGQPNYEKGYPQAFYDAVKKDPRLLKEYEDAVLPRELFRLGEWFYFSSMVVVR